MAIFVKQGMLLLFEDTCVIMRLFRLFAFLIPVLCISCAAEKPGNVLFIIVDDLRPELNCYGNPVIHSPHIDQLASEGILFKNAYSNVPVCGASRASFLTGLRPTRDRFLTFYAAAEEDAPGVVSIPQYFKNNGYTTISNGKVFHNQDDHAGAWDINRRPDSPGRPFDYYLPESRNKEQNKRGKAYEAPEAHDSVYNDGKIAALAVDDLRKLKESGKPFFMAVGFWKPHLPFNAPKKYWDLYEGKVSLPDNNYVPENAPKISIHNSGELRNYDGIPAKGPVSDSVARTLIHGYYACVSYVDAQIGRVLQELKDLGLDENTHVVLIGDHGYNLLEHTLWCKHSNYKTSLRSAMIVKSPRAEAGGISNQFVEFVDIFPSLIELTGLKPLDHLQGQSFAGQLADPDEEAGGFAISKFTTGVTLSTPDYAFTQWLDEDLQARAEMLYDHRKDPEENRNVSGAPEYQAVKDSLRGVLRKEWGPDF